MISVSGLRKSYGDFVAVDDLEFQIEKGETCGLLGPNGAGKSTTIGMMVGLLRPDSGSISIGIGSDSGAPTESQIRNRIGISPQSLSLYEDLTAKENLDFFGGLYGLNGAKLAERTDWSLDFSGLSDRMRDRVKTFSGGMKRRLNIAVAMMHEPDILLLDEPTVGVDPQSRNHIFDSIESLKDQGLTIIYTTHYMEEAQRLCDRVAIIDHGKLLALNSVENLIDEFGGQSVLSAVVNDSESIQAIEHELIDNLTVQENQIRFVSDKPFDAIAELTNQWGIRFESLQMARPDLESVFLNLTGRSLRD